MEDSTRVILVICFLTTLLLQSGCVYNLSGSEKDTNYISKVPVFADGVKFTVNNNETEKIISTIWSGNKYRVLDFSLIVENTNPYPVNFSIQESKLRYNRGERYYPTMPRSDSLSVGFPDEEVLPGQVKKFEIQADLVIGEFIENESLIFSDMEVYKNQ